MLGWVKSNRKAVILFVTLSIVTIALSLSYGDFDSPTYGRIWIDSPEIYTRERLVNDRFVEDAWLRRELENTVELNSGVSQKFGNVDRLKLEISSLTGSSNDDDSKHNINRDSENGLEAKRNSDPDGRDKIKTLLSSVDRFREVLEYRREVRDAIIENQLDDRHDLLGNSLYRLKFDATILPEGVNTTSPARITILINGPQDSKDLKHEISTLEELNPEAIERWRDRYTRWQKSIKNRLENEYRRLSYARTADRLPTAYLLEFFDVVIKNRNNHFTEETGTAIADTQKMLSDSKDQDIKALKAKLINLYALAMKESKIYHDELMLKYSDEMVSGNELVETNYFQDSETCKSSENSNYISDGASSVSTVYVSEGSGLYFQSLLDHELDSYLDKKVRFKVYGQPYFGNDYKLEGSDTIEEFAEVSINPGSPLGNVYSVESTSIPLKLLPLTANEKETVLAKVKELIDSKGLEKGHLELPLKIEDKCKPEMAVVLFPLKNKRGEIEIEFFKTHKSVLINTQRAGSFNVVVDTIRSLKKSGDLDENKEHRIDIELGLLNFVNVLGTHGRAFSYTITPKGAGQLTNIQIESNSDRSLDSIIGFDGRLTNVNIGVDSYNASLQSKSATMRRPLVVGFSKSMTDGAMEIGWNINPGYIDSASSKPFFRHVAAQYPLTALISVPAWWRNISLEIDAQWLDKTEKSTDELDPIELILPVDYDALEALLFDQEQSGPTIEEDELEQQSLVIGRAADVLVPGRGLWRSTVVTLGGQKAVRITVLPNMKGIIAHFDEIQKPNGWRSGQSDGVKIPITIWTSQGSATLPTRVTILDETRDGK